MALPQFIEEDISELAVALADLLGKSEARSALLIDRGGFLITETGLTECDTTTLAALAAASYAATASIAGLVGEPNFSSVYQQGETFSMLIQHVDEECLLTIVFKAETSVGAVKYYARQTREVIARQLQIARERNPDLKIDLAMLNVVDTKPIFSRKNIPQQPLS